MAKHVIDCPIFEQRGLVEIGIAQRVEDGGEGGALGAEVIGLLPGSILWRDFKQQGSGPDLFGNGGRGQGDFARDFGQNFVLHLHRL